MADNRLDPFDASKSMRLTGTTQSGNAENGRGRMLISLSGNPFFERKSAAGSIGIYAFHKKYGYGVHSLVEARISRIKRCIGERLLTQKLASQEGEGVIITNGIEIIQPACRRYSRTAC